MTEKNPLIENYNYWAPYQQSIDKNKAAHPETVQFAKVCHDTFETPAGRKLMEMIEQKYLIPAMVMVGASDYATLSVYANGFKDGLLMLKAAVLAHQRLVNQTKDKK